MARSEHAMKPCPVDGAWDARLDIGVTVLRLRLEIRREGGVLVSLDQGGHAIPVVVRQDADHVVLEAPSVVGSFSGTCVGPDRIVGTWHQETDTPLTFLRKGASPLLLPLSRDLEGWRATAGCPALGMDTCVAGGASMRHVVGRRAMDRPVVAMVGDLWHLGSLTKAMTALLVARLVEAGRLRWEQTIGSTFGAKASGAYGSCNLLNLLSHTAGLPGDLLIEETMRFAEEVADPRSARRAYAFRALALPPDGPPGAVMSYANNGYIVAGAMIEAVTDMSWEQAMREDIFGPLGLASAGFGAPPISEPPSQPIGHTSDKGALRPVRDGLLDNVQASGPAGRVHMSLGDMAKCLTAQRDRSAFLRPETWKRLHTPPFGGTYALGWFVRADGSLWHNGSNTLWYTEATIVPRRLAVVAVANAADASTQRAVRSALNAAQGA